GGAWDNAKKIVEVDLRQKGTDLHAATVVGDTVGDPFKDTSSVAMNPVIKFTTLFGLLAVEIAVTMTNPHLKTGIGVFFFLVSLLPGCTEIVGELGLREQLVGRSHECDFPPAVRRLPACTRPKLNVQAASLQIDREVNALLQDALSIYQIDAGKLKQLRPDFILTQSQCEVCAVSLSEVEQAVSGWVGFQPRVLSLAPNALADVWNDILKVAGALGVAERGVEVVARLKDRVESIAARTRHLPQRPSVACIEWLDPLMAAGNWVPELVELAGGLNLFGEGRALR